MASGKLMRFLKLFILVLFVALQSTSAVADDEVPTLPAVNGFYPLWDGTALVLDQRRALLGINNAQFGIGYGTQLSIKPSLFVVRTPNIAGKMVFYEKDGLHLAAQTGVFAFLRHASSSFFSPQYTSRLDNSGTTVWVTPLSFITTYEVAPWLNVHNSLTGMGIWAKSTFANKVFVGDMLTAEFKAFRRHSVFLNAGEIGMWDHDLWVLGASYRYVYDWFEVRLGYFYRISKDGVQSSPLLDLGIIL